MNKYIKKLITISSAATALVCTQYKAGHDASHGLRLTRVLKIDGLLMIDDLAYSNLCCYNFYEILETLALLFLH